MARSTIPKSLAPDINALNSNTNGIFDRADGNLFNIDLNTLLKTGSYYCTTGCTNAPVSFLNVLVINSNAMITQIAFHSNDTIYLRRKTNAEWSPWKKIALA